MLQFPLLHLIRLHWESGGAVITATAAQFLYPVLVTVALVVFALALLPLTAGRRHFVVPDRTGQDPSACLLTITPPGPTDRRTTVPLPVAA
ncbi:MAG: hypothetical protein U0R64_06105 [Candidatus Nanopelagicales bacterium]